MKRLATKRTTEGKTPQGLRIGIRGGGCTGFAYLFEWADTPPRDSDKVFEFERIAEAFQYLEQGRAKGKVVVRMGVAT